MLTGSYWGDRLERMHMCFEGDEESTNGFGGEESRLVLFPTEEDAERFAEYGWPAKEPEVENE